jgi:hypothetical protein
MVDVVYHKDGTPQCGKCNTGYEDAEGAKYCCTSCVDCGFRHHGMHERAQECCPCSCPDECFCDENGDCCQDYLKDYSSEDEYIRCDWCNNGIGTLEELESGEVEYLGDDGDIVCMTCVTKQGIPYDVSHSEWHHANTVCPECNSDDVDYTKVYYCSQCGEDDLVPGEQCSCGNIVGSKDYFEQMICGDCDAAWIEDDYSAESPGSTSYYIDEMVSISDEDDFQTLFNLYLDLYDDIADMESANMMKTQRYQRAKQQLSDLSARLDELQTEVKIMPEFEFEADNRIMLGRGLTMGAIALYGLVAYWGLKLIRKV